MYLKAGGGISGTMPVFLYCNMSSVDSSLKVFAPDAHAAALCARVIARSIR